MGLTTTLFLMGAPAHRALLPWLRPIWMATISPPGTGHQAPFSSIRHQSTRHRANRHLATYNWSTRHWATRHQATRHWAIYHRATRHQAISHRSSDTTLTKKQGFWQYIAAILPQYILAVLPQYCGNTGFRMQISLPQYCGNDPFRCTGLSCTLGSLPPGGEDTLGYLAPTLGSLPPRGEAASGQLAPPPPGVKIPWPGQLAPTPRKPDRT